MITACPQTGHLGHAESLCWFPEAQAGLLWPPLPEMVFFSHFFFPTSPPSASPHPHLLPTPTFSPPPPSPHPHTPPSVGEFQPSGLRLDGTFPESLCWPPMSLHRTLLIPSGRVAQGSWPYPFWRSVLYGDRAICATH